MDPSRGDSRYNLNYMGGIGLSLADPADIYGNPGGLSSTGRPPSGGLIPSMGRASSAGGGGMMGHGGGSGSGGAGSGQCQTLGVSGQQSRGVKRTSSDCYDDHHRSGSGGMSQQQTLQGLESCAGGGVGGQPGSGGGNVPDGVDDGYTSLQNKKSPPANGKKTKGRVKIKMEYIDNKLRRYTTFSKRKTGIMKKTLFNPPDELNSFLGELNGFLDEDTFIAFVDELDNNIKPELHARRVMPNEDKAYELSTLTGTQVMLLVASETGHVYTFATRKLQPMITSEAGKQLIQTCLNSPDPPNSGGGDQRMSATGFEETELSYNIADEDSKDDRSLLSSGADSDDSSDVDDPSPGHGRMAAASANSNNSNPNVIVSTHDDLKATSLGHFSSVNNAIYSTSGISQIPQEILLGLVQSGHLQLHTEDDGHQLASMPITMTATPSSSSSGENAASANASRSSGRGNNKNNSGGGGRNRNVKGSRSQVKDLSTKSNKNSSANGRKASPDICEITIKEEIFE